MKKVFILFIVSIMFLSFNSVKGKTHQEEVDELIKDLIKSNLNLNIDDISSKAGNSVNDWYLIALYRLNPDDLYISYKAMLKVKIDSLFSNQSQLNKTLSTDWHRMILSSIAANIDPRNVEIDDYSYNLLDYSILSDQATNKINNQGINGWLFSLIAIDSLKFETTISRNDIIKNILKYELKDGGFSFSGLEFDVDMTAMVIQALAPYYNSTNLFEIGTNKKVRIKDVINRNLNLLSQSQKEDGDFESYGVRNVESTAQVLIALSSLGIDATKDARFIKNDNSILDGIKKYRASDGSFKRTETSNYIASWQVLSALVSYKLLLNGSRNYYDFRQPIEYEILNNIKSLREEIDSIEDTNISKLNILYEIYQTIPSTERMYVYNYNKLEEMLIKNNIEIIDLIEKYNDVIIEDKVYEFTEDDINKIISLEKSVRLDSKIEAYTLLEKIKSSNEFIDKFKYQNKLIIIKNKIIEIENKIDNLNQKIYDHINLNENVNKRILEEIIEEYNQIQKEDRKYVNDYDIVLKLYNKYDSFNIENIIKYSLIVSACLISGYVIFRLSRKKKVLGDED